jgi:hypothetical protein
MPYEPDIYEKEDYFEPRRNVICEGCRDWTNTKMIDFGIGPYECHGVCGHHTDVHEATECCECDWYDNPMAWVVLNDEGEKDLLIQMKEHEEPKMGDMVVDLMDFDAHDNNGGEDDLWEWGLEIGICVVEDRTVKSGNKED